MSEEVAKETPTAWDVPAIERPAEELLVTAGNLEALQQTAYDEAFEKGYAEGLDAGEAAVKERVQRYDELLQALTKPFDRLDDTVEKQLVELAVAVVRQLFRREIRIDPTHVIGVVREAIQLLPVASQNVQVHLHPEDATLIRESLSPAEGELAWGIVEDPLLTRGGCKVSTENTQVDATAESRLQAVITAVAGDQRQ